MEAEQKKALSRRAKKDAIIFFIAFVIVQAAIIILYGFFTEHDSFVKCGSIFPFSDIIRQYPTVTPISITVDETGREVGNPITTVFRVGEPRAQSMFTYIVDVSLFVFLGLGLSFTFLRKYGYSALGFSLLIAAVSFQWGILVVKFAENQHCTYLKSLSTGDRCQLQYTVDQYQDTYDMEQAVQGCVCVNFDRFAANETLRNLDPNRAADILRILGRTSFSSKIQLNLDHLMTGLYACVPVLITFGVLLGKVELLHDPEFIF